MSEKLEAERRRMNLWVLKGSIALCVGFILVGLELFLIRAGAYFPKTPSGSIFAIVADAWSGMLDLRPSAYLDAGIVVLLFTPLARLAAGVIANVRARDWLYVGIGGVVIGLVLMGLIMGQGTA